MEKKYAITSEIACSLADSVISQYYSMPLAVGVIEIRNKRDILAKMLQDTPVWEDPGGKMQFPIEQDEKNKIEEYGSHGHLIQSFKPRRIIVNFDTGYDEKKEFPAVTLWKSLRELLHGKEITKFDPEVIGRYVRFDERIGEIRKRSLAAGYPYGLMVHLETTLEAMDGGDIPGTIHTPLIFIPGASQEDLETIAAFSVFHQNPRHEDIRSYQTHGVFKENIYALYQERKDNLLKLLDGLTRLDNQDKLISYKQKHLRRLLKFMLRTSKK